MPREGAPGAARTVLGGALVATLIVYALVAGALIEKNVERHAQSVAFNWLEGANTFCPMPELLDVPPHTSFSMDIRRGQPGLFLLIRAILLVVGEDRSGTYDIIYYENIAFLILGVLGLYMLGLRVFGAPAPAFVLALLLLLAPISAFYTFFWMQNPHLLLTFLMVEALYRERPAAFLALACAQAVIYPPTIISSFLLAWMAWRRGGPPMLPGMGPPSPLTRRWFHAGTLVMLLSAGALGTYMFLPLLQGETGSYTWHIVSRKLVTAPDILADTLRQQAFLLAPMLFLPLLNRRFLPALVPMLAYTVLNAAGVVTGGLPYYVALLFVSLADLLARQAPRVRRTLLGGMVAATLLLNVWPHLGHQFSGHVLDPWSGGLLTPAMYRDEAHERRLEQTIAAHIPPGSRRCLTDPALVPRVTDRCRPTTSLVYTWVGRRLSIEDFLATYDRGRLDQGHWEFILIDRIRSAGDPGLLPLRVRIERSGRYVLIQDDADLILWRRERRAEP